MWSAVYVDIVFVIVFGKVLDHCGMSGEKIAAQDIGDSLANTIL